MRELVDFITKFYQNKGLWIASSSIYSKLTLVLVSFYIIPMLDKEVYGKLTYALSIISFLVVFSGLGSNVGFLRFGPLVKNEKEQNELASYSFFYGLLSSILVLIVVVPALWFLAKNDKVIYWFMCLLSFRMVSHFIQFYQNCYFRVRKENQLLANYEFVTATIYLILAFILVHWYLEIGYIIALIVAPLLGFVLFIRKQKWTKPVIKWRFNVTTRKKFWEYSILSSFTSLTSQIIFMADIFIVSNTLGDSATAEYRVASLIPLNLLILPIIFMKTDLTRITENYLNKPFLKNYYKNYLKLFGVISVFGMLVAIFLGKWILSWFGDQYGPYQLFVILMVASSFSICFRVPLGNIIAGLGKIKINTYVALITLAINVTLNYLLIPEYGLIGAAWATFASLTFSGFLNLAYFVHYLRKLDNPMFNRQ